MTRWLVLLCATGCSLSLPEPPGGAAARAALLVGPAVPLPVRVPGNAQRRQTAPAVATLGSRTFVVWQDGRVVPGVELLFGARIEADGGFLDPFGLPLHSPAYGDVHELPSVATDGTQLFVAWQEHPFPRWGVSALRFDGSGQRLDPSPLVFATNQSSQTEPTAAFDGTDFIVAWATSRRIRVARATGAGEMVDGGALFASPPGVAASAPYLSATGPVLLLTYDVSLDAGVSEVWGQLLPARGAVGAPFVVDPAPSAGARSAPVDAGFVVAWRRSSPLKVVGARLQLDGGFIDAAPVTLHLPPVGEVVVTGIVVMGDAAWVGTRVSTADAGDVFAAALDLSTGVALGAPTAIAATTAQEGDLSFAPLPSGALAVWSVRGGSLDDLRTAPVTYGGGMFTVAPPAVLTRSADSQEGPAMAASTGGVVLVHSQDNAGSADVFSQVLLADGGWGARFPVSLAGADEKNPRVARGASGLLAVWEEGSLDTIRAARLTFAGQLVPGSTFTVPGPGGDQHFQEVAFDGTGFWVAWVDGPTDTATLQGVQVSEAGAPGPLRALAPGIAGASDLRAAQGPGHALLVFLDRANAGDVLGLRLFPDGGADAPTLLAGGPRRQGPAAAAWNGSQFVLAWRDSFDDGGVEVRVSGVDPSTLQTSAPVTLSTDVAPDVDPEVAFDGARVWVVWRRLSNTGGADALFARSVGPSLQPLEPAPVQLQPGGYPFTAVSLQSDVRGRTWVAWSRFEPAPAFVSHRIEVLSLDHLGQSAACTNPADCASGFCVDGVCCDAACGAGSPFDCLGCSVAAGAASDGVCGPVSATFMCRPRSECGPRATCDGVDTTCPGSVAPDGTACDGGSCQSGVCQAPPDAGVDAGVDSGTPDSGTPDGGAADGGTSARNLTVGCGCSGGPLEVCWAALCVALCRCARRRPEKSR